MVSFYCRYITSEIPGFVPLVKVVHKENSGRFIYFDELGFMFCHLHVYLHISNYHWSCAAAHHSLGDRGSISHPFYLLTVRHSCGDGNEPSRSFTVPGDGPY